MDERTGILKAIQRIKSEARLHSVLLGLAGLVLFFPAIWLLIAAFEYNSRNTGFWGYDFAMLVLPTVVTILVYQARKRRFMRQLKAYSIMAALAAGHDAGREAANTEHWLMRIIQPQRQELKAQLLITAQHIGRTLSVLEKRSLGLDYRRHWYESPMVILLLVLLPQITLWTISSLGWSGSDSLIGRDTDMLEMYLGILQVAVFPAAFAVPIFKFMQLREFAAYLRRELGFGTMEQGGFQVDERKQPDQS